MNKTIIFQDAMGFLAGSCLHTAQSALETVLDETGVQVTTELVDEFEQYLESHDCFNCEICGWWTHPGEEASPICTECLNEMEDLEELDD